MSRIRAGYDRELGLGSYGTPANADWTAPGDRVSGFFGFSVSSLGDVNKDGGDDVIGGAPDVSSSMQDGFAYAYYGTAPISGLSATSDAPTIIGTRLTSRPLSPRAAL
jgi:hypothetical protein